MGEVRIAKKDVIADVDNGFGQAIPTKVAVEGDVVSPAYAEHVDDSDVDTEVAKTRSTADRRAAADEADDEAPDHDEVMAAAAHPAEPAEAKKRARSQNKARRGAGNKSDDDD